MQKLEAHELAKLFPLATECEVAEMAADIKQRGLMSPIVIYEGKILDGRNRYAACIIANVNPTLTEYVGGDPLGDVIGWNLHRRQLSTSQRAAVALELKPLFEKQAKERRRGGPGGVLLPPNSEEAPKLQRESSSKAAKAVNVGRGIVNDAEFVRSNSPEKFEEVKAGIKTVNAAKREIIDATPKEEKQEEEPTTTRKRVTQVAPCNGMQFAGIAIRALTQIKSNDTERKEAFKTIKEWIHDNE